MNKPTETSSSSTGRVREHFRAKAFSFDALYDEEHALQRTLRPGLFDRRELALDLARARLERFADKVELVQADFLTAPLEGPFDIALALGYFDYIEDAAAHLRRIGELTSGSMVASFPRWTWTKGPVRKLRYEVINNCPIFDYTEDGLKQLLVDAGFAKTEIKAGKSGFLVRADRKP